MSEQYSGHMIVDLMNTVGKMDLVSSTPSEGTDVAVSSASPRRTGNEKGRAGHPSLDSDADWA